MAEINLKYKSEVKKLGFKALREYVASVGLDKPSHVTKSTLLKLIFQEKKYMEDPVEEDFGASPSTVEVQQATSPKAKRGSVFNENDFLKQSQEDKRANRACKQFRNHFPVLSQQPVRVLQNTIFMLDISPKELEDAILNCNVDVLGRGAIIELGSLFGQLNIADWNNAVNDSYDPGENSSTKFSRLFTFLEIPNVMDRIMDLAKIVRLQEDLDSDNKFTDEVHRALHEVVNDSALARYLIAVLLFTRAKNAEQINISKMKLTWKGASPGICLLRNLIRSLPVTAHDRFVAKNFDQIQERKKRKRPKQGMGDIMKSHFENAKDQVEQGVFFETEETSTPPPAAPINALLEELTSKTSEIKPVTFKKKTSKPKQKVNETEQNLKRLEFRVPQYKVRNQWATIENIGKVAETKGYESHLELLEKVKISHNRLAATNENLLELWKSAERDYFLKLRTNYMKNIRDPEYIVLTEIVEDKWGLYLPNSVWGDIWEFRTPFQEKIDMRFAMEAYEDFLQEYGI